MKKYKNGSKAKHCFATQRRPRADQKKTRQTKKKVNHGGFGPRAPPVVLDARTRQRGGPGACSLVRAAVEFLGEAVVLVELATAGR